MPVLKLQVAPLQNPERYQRLAAALTRLMAELLGKQADLTAVVIQDLPAAQWHIGGAAVEHPTALLEVNITAGTNTPSQKAAFIVAAYAELERQLGAGGPLAQASYVIIRELPAGDWGYGGRTQAERARRRAEIALMAG
jgi:4-oxalocrotonate tautomerase